MAEALPDGHLLSYQEFEVEDVEFVCRFAPGGTANRFFIVKPPTLIERYRTLAASEWRSAKIFELGIAQGGSTALLASRSEASAPCSCGGSFRRDAPPRCPSCRAPLSASTARSWIEAKERAKGREGSWQGSWDGPRCIVIENRVVSEDWPS